jgi:hypothetical protein
MPVDRPYPLELAGALDPQLSRWQWLLKWLLGIPHYVVLLFLWIAYGVLTLVAFFAILFTGRYPRAIFDFNVGVLRWTWRVAFWSYGVLGTDRYPPFTLAHDPDYPATLDVAYPERLSRGLVLVKWWLLAIPHYLVVGVLIGGGWLAARDEGWQGGGGLVALLVAFAAIALLFVARYPRGIFDLVMGAQRWAFRVAAYATLMTDAYPPFRLDQGGDEPGDREQAAPVPGAPAAGAVPGAVAASQPATTSGHWNVGRIAAVVLGSLVALVGLALVIGGIAAIVVDRTQRDDDGYVTSPTEDFSARGYALVSERIDLAIDGPDWAVRDVLGRVRIGSESDRPLFVGIGRDEDVDAYLSGVRRSVVTDFGHGHDRDDLVRGGAPPTLPAAQPFWVASSRGAGSRTLTWEVDEGSWNVVVMNADGSRGVAADLNVGARLEDLGWIGLGLLVGGLLLLGIAAALIYMGIPRSRAPADE